MLRISLRSTARRTLFGCGALLALAQFVALGSRAARAHAWADGDQRWQFERAVALEPRNAEYWFRLGQWDWLANQDSASALRAYGMAVQLNPRSADYHLEIARVSLFNNDTAQMTSALEDAIRVDPTTPSVNWEAGNLYLAAHRTDRALPLIRNAAASWWEYRSPAISICWQATHDVNRAIAEALPQDPEIYGEFLRYLVSRQETAAADTLWSRLVVLHQAVPAKSAFLYIDALLERHRVSDAARVWRELALLSPAILPYLPSSGASDDAANQVVNSGFEQEILNDGFDWRIAPQDNVTVETTAEESFHGGHSLAVNFDASNTGNAGILQWVPLQPGASYVLSFAYKAEELEGAHGISLVVSDAATQKPLLTTSEMTGSSAWQELHQSFHTGPSTDLVALELKRPSGTLIRGKLWLDEVRIVKQMSGKQ
jgi:tetratricopeptide (TPR) repeat protein